MNKAFCDLRDRLSTTSHGDAESYALRHTSMRFEELMQSARNPSEADAPLADSAVGEGTASKSQPCESQASVAEMITAGVNVPSWLDQSLQPRHVSTAEMPWGYSILSEHKEVIQQPDYFNFANSPQALVLQRSSVHHSSQLSPQPQPPVIYHFQETSFGRMFHRACLEAAYQALLDPSRRPQDIERIFRLSLMGRDRAKMTASVRAILDRGAHEPLDFWEAPLIHVGGAGTHYGRRDAFGNIQPRKAIYNLGLIGPQTLALLESAVKINLTTDVTVDVVGFEGVWFDPYDCEGYLEEKYGVHIDPSSVFTDAEFIDPGTPYSETTLASSTSPSTPAMDLSAFDQSTQVNAVVSLPLRVILSR